MSVRPTRRASKRLGAVALAATFTITTASASAAPSDPDDDDDARVLSTGQQLAPKSAPGTKPKGVDPYRGIVIDPAKVDYAGWARELRANSAKRNADAFDIPTSSAAARRAAAANDAVFYQEREPVGTRGSNDRIANAEPIADVGTGSSDSARAFVLGRGSPQAHPTTQTTLTPQPEDNGAIPLALDTGVQNVRRAAKVDGTIGDGPHGAAPGGDESGDFDVFKVNLRLGQELLANGVATGTGVNSLDGYIGLYDAEGTLVAVDDDSGEGFAPLLEFTAAEAGDYYVFLGGYRFGDKLPSDPFDSGSGPGMGDTGPYTMVLSTRFADVDYFRLEAEAGDVLGLNLDENATLIGIHEGSGKLVHGSDQDATFLYPPNSPLPGGGNAVAAHVVREDGPIYFAVRDSDGLYTVDVAMYRPGPEYRSSPKVKQTFFLDFDGETVNTAIWGGPGVRTLSPLSAFLANWDLAAADESALISRIRNTFTENLRRDLKALNPNLELVVKNSRDHADPWGQPNVSRVIVGGTIDESGIPTIGIAQYIDPGNYGTEDSSVVLLDLLSEEAGADYSLNTYITEESDVIDFVGTAIGNVASHEAGHQTGSYHVDQFNDIASLMDQGGNAEVLFGVGPDGVGGTEDDPDVDFNEDVYNPNEGFIGLEDTAVRTAWAHSRGAGLVPYPV